MLRRLFVDNFRCLVNFELRPGKATLLLGKNGAGKSTVFDALWVIASILRGSRVEEVAPRFSMARWDIRTIQTFEVEAVLASGKAPGNYRYRLEIEHATSPPGTRVLTERLWFDDKPVFEFGDGNVQLFNEEFAPAAKFVFDAVHCPLSTLAAQNRMTEAFLDFASRIMLFRLNPGTMTWLSEGESSGLAVDGRNFAHWWRATTQEDPESSEKLNRSLKEVFPHFEWLRFERFDGSRKGLVAQFKPPAGGSYSLPFTDLSDGQRCLTILYAVAHGMAQRSSVLLLDEPENYVGLVELSPILYALRDVVEVGDSQMIVISHHPQVVDYLAGDTTFMLSRATSEAATAAPFLVDRATGGTASETYKILAG